MDTVESEKVNEIFMVWSPEEIKHYYGLMRYQCTEQDFKEIEFVENEVEMIWDHTTCTTKRHLDFMMWNKKMKQDESFKIWSNKFGKKFH